MHRAARDIHIRALDPINSNANLSGQMNNASAINLYGSMVKASLWPLSGTNGLDDMSAATTRSDSAEVKQHCRNAATLSRGDGRACCLSLTSLVRSQ